MKEDDDEKKGGTKKKVSETVGAQFKGQLASLMGTLSSTSPHFVRCVKPNTLKQANNFDRDIVLAQLRYAGIIPFLYLFFALLLFFHASSPICE